MPKDKEELASERASKYLEAARISQDQLWKRRHVEWRTGFALWTAIAVSAAFIFANVNRPLPDPGKWVVLIALLAVYTLVIFLHRRHLKAIFISNERDLDFLNYYTNRAAWELGETDFQKKPTRPKWADCGPETWGCISEELKFYLERKDKMRHHYTQVLITSLIALLSWGLLALMCVEDWLPK